MTRDVLLGFGGNEGDVARAFEEGLAWLEKLPCVRRLRASRLWTYPPMGCEPQAAPFCNGVVRLSVAEALTPDAFFAHVMTLDRKKKQEKTERWHSRQADWDLLLFGDCEIHDWPRLIVPHPFLPWRRFVLEPALEIAADMRHPSTGKTLEQLLDQLHAGAEVMEINVACREDAARRDRARTLGVPYLDCRDVWRSEENIPTQKIVSLARGAYGDFRTSPKK
ncbi:MAG: 2-amino-4-hydroxy-6-hydroxymethyldihydropteridine diphosphokinase [Planctomycetia bacterium]|nr:2-amino-4-hydroxy-6-hydroxymethyldihydropteridine diphosphokinase [Planctomycetia bacterium]